MYYRQQKLAASGGNAVIGDGDRINFTRDYEEEARLGKVISQIGLDYLKIDEEARYNDELATNRVKAIKQFNEYDTGLNSNADTSTYQEGLDKTKQAIRQSVKFTNARAQNEFDTWLAAQETQWDRQVQGKKWSIDARNYENNFNLNAQTIQSLGATAQTPQEYDRYKTDLASLYGVTINPQTKQPELIEGWSNPLLESPEVRMSGYNAAVTKMDAHHQKFIADQTFDTIQGGAQNIIDQGGSEQDAQQFIDENIKGSVLGPDEKRRLYEHAGGYYGNKAKQNKTSDYQKTVASYSDFSQKLLTNELTMDEVENAPLGDKKEEKKRKENLKTYITQAAKDSPTETTPAGYRTVTKVLADHTAGTITAAQAYEGLLEARYGKKPTITDADYAWAIHRIQKPYPKQFMADLAPIVEHNYGWFENKQTGRPGYWWHKDEADKMSSDVNRSLIEWADSEIAQGKTPTAGDLYEKSRVLNVMYLQKAANAEKGQTQTQPKPDQWATRLASAPDADFDPYWKKLDDGTKKQVWQLYQSEPNKQKMLERLKRLYGAVR